MQRASFKNPCASVPIPKFAGISGHLGANFAIEEDTRNIMIPVPLLNPKFATVLAARSCELRVRGAEGLSLHGCGNHTGQAAKPAGLVPISSPAGLYRSRHEPRQTPGRQSAA